MQIKDCQAAFNYYLLNAQIKKYDCMSLMCPGSVAGPALQQLNETDLISSSSELRRKQAVKQ